MKKLIVTVLAAVSVACSAAAVLAACADAGGITDVTARFSDGEVVLEWKGGAAEVWRSDERDGTYTMVAEADGSYSSEDYSAYYVLKQTKGGEVVSQTEPYCYYDIFGENVRVYDENDDEEEIQSEIDEVYSRLVSSEFSLERSAFIFMPGEYPQVTAKIGYYTSFYGAGYSPEEVTLGGFYVPQRPDMNNCLTNFWRSAENFSVASDAQWSVSQATSLRRMNIAGDLSLDSGGYSSGGFLADSTVAGDINNSTQQQWFTRNSSFTEWTKTDINMVFSGVEGEIRGEWPSTRNTVLETTGSLREKPYIMFDERQGFGVFVPDLREDTKGVSWKGGTPGEFIPLTDFYIADADRDTADSLNAALAQGMHLLLTPGIYVLDEPLYIGLGETVVLGMGLATLQTAPSNTPGCVQIADVPGVCFGGVLLDAGSECEMLMRVGETVHANAGGKPVSLSDVFFRIGGGRFPDGKDGTLSPRTVSVDTALEINSDNVIGDNFWVWRADHTFGVGWQGEEISNYAKHGVVVNGDDVRCYGLMVEHFGEYQTLWNGENGFVCFYQSETPYDATDQSAWMNGASRGFASYKVADGVQTHTAYGIGVYFVCYSHNVQLDTAIEAPSNAGISIIHMAIANFQPSEDDSGRSLGINSVINGHGKSVLTGGAKQPFTSFIAGNYTE